MNTDNYLDDQQKLNKTIDAFLRRRAHRYSKQDARFEALMAWAQEVSEKTGIPMPEL